MKKSIIAAMSVLLFTASCGDAQADEGLVPRLERLAGRGNAEAVYHLGMAYQTGTDLPRDPAKALDAFRRAAALGDPLAAFAVAAVIFGLVHLYQGWKGVIATGAMGAFMSFIYILSGSLWLVVLIHVLIDLNGLFLRPFLARRFGKSEEADQAQA